MNILLGTLTRCAGQGHWQIPVTVNGVTRTLSTTPSELRDAGPNDLQDGRDFVIKRIRSALLEADAATFGQAGTAINNKIFKV